MRMKRLVHSKAPYYKLIDTLYPGRIFLSNIRSFHSILPSNAHQVYHAVHRKIAEIKSLFPLQTWKERHRKMKNIPLGGLCGQGIMFILFDNMIPGLKDQKSDASLLAKKLLIPTL